VGRPVLFPHPLGELPQAGTRFSIDPLPQATEGSSETVNAGMFVSMRFVADLSDWDRSRQGIALGESGDPSSPHWKDQLADWRSVTTRTFPFSREAVARAAVETQVLVPIGKRAEGGDAPASPKPR
jgi:penicillin amidase